MDSRSFFMKKIRNSVTFYPFLLFILMKGLLKQMKGGECYKYPKKQRYRKAEAYI